MELDAILRDRDIVIFASAPWVTDGRYNCHHIARRLAANNRVLYVESPGLRTPNPFHRADLLKILRRLGGWLRSRRRGSWKAMDNLFVLSPVIVPFHGWPLLERLNSALLGRACARAARVLKFDRPVLWAFLPIAAGLLGRLNESAVIYHCVDNYTANPGVNAAEIEESEKRLVEAADLCIATSAPLAERLLRMSAKVECFPNVAEVGRFSAQSRECPEEISRLPKPVIGYLGNIAAYKVDLDLLGEIASRRPDWSLVLVGPLGVGDPSTKLDGLRSLKNVHIIGARPYERIPAYVRNFDVGLVPFRRSSATDYSLPHKTFEYLAAGKPVVSSPLSSLTAEPLSDVVKYAGNGEEFVRAIEECLAGDDSDKRRLRREVASRYSWEKRFAEIDARVADVVAEREREDGL
ncbi:MAG: glycosyltransferase [Planctomycetota bacterium]